MCSFPAPARILCTAIAACMLTGCYSQSSVDAHAASRRQTLLELYPLEKTTRKDVHARWRSVEPQPQARRPAAGWDAYPEAWVTKRVRNAEARIGRKITSVERFFGPDGISSLCYCWYYYDSSDRLIDAEWQWSSD